jgi:hypothetical protein
MCCLNKVSHTPSNEKLSNYFGDCFYDQSFGLPVFITFLLTYYLFLNPNLKECELRLKGQSHEMFVAGEYAGAGGGEPQVCAGDENLGAPRVASQSG